MESLKELYRIGRGPSSSHTMGPSFAAERFRSAFPKADSFQVTLFGSLAKTGRGHLTDVAVREALEPLPTVITFDTTTEDLPHPNTMTLEAFQNGVSLGSWRVMSVGGGKIAVEDLVLGDSAPGAGPSADPPRVYPLSTFTDIKNYCRDRDIYLWQYVEQCEGPGIWDYLSNVWETMKEAVYRGIRRDGELSGGLGVQRKAMYLNRQRHMDESKETRENRKVCAYAFAVSEENAGGGTIVTAPTCGACGVLPAVMLYKQEQQGFSDRDMLKGLAVAGLVGNVIKTNASISGAECGCQAEIGSACSMAAAGLAEIYHMDMDQIEYEAEVAMEHHLGLTCDPIGGLVQIPCIERNAVAGMRAINALSLANFLTYTRKISFDMVVRTMYETGRDLFSKYRETSEGGLAKVYTE